MSETDPTIAIRSARYRARKKGKRASCPVCPTPGCGARVLTLRPGGLCGRCWLKTDEGRAYQRARVAEFRRQAKKKAGPADLETVPPATLTPATDALQYEDRGREVVPATTRNHESNRNDHRRDPDPR